SRASSCADLVGCSAGADELEFDSTATADITSPLSRSCSAKRLRSRLCASRTVLSLRNDSDLARAKLTSASESKMDTIWRYSRHAETRSPEFAVDSARSLADASCAAMKRSSRGSRFDFMA